MPWPSRSCVVGWLGRVELCGWLGVEFASPILTKRIITIPLVLLSAVTGVPFFLISSGDSKAYALSGVLRAVVVVVVVLLLGDALAGTAAGV